MAENIATLGLRLDASGFIVGTRQVESSLNSLSTASGKVEGKVRAFSMNSAFALSSLASSGARDITSVLRSLSSLGFAFGVQVGVITLAISAIADAWSESSRKAKEEQEKQLADLQAFQQKFTLAATRTRIGTLEQRDAALAGHQRSEMGPGFVGSIGGDLGDIMRERKKIAAELGALRLQETQQVKALLVEEQKVTEERRKQSDEALKSIQADAVKRYVAQLVEADDAMRALAAAGKEMEASMAATDAAKVATEMDAIVASLQRSLDLIGIKLDKEKETTRELERQKQVRNQMLIGAGLGLLRATGPMGAVGADAIGAGIEGFKNAGVFGAAFASVNSLVGSIINMGKASRESARALQDFITAQRIAVGDLTQEEIAAQQVAERYRQELEKIAGVQRHWNDLLVKGKITQEQYNFIMEGLNQQTATLVDLQRRSAAATDASTAAREAEIAQMRTFADRELDIRELRAFGMDEQAESMARALEKERELSQARKDGATETELSRIAEVQRAEDIKKAMDKIQTTIDGFTNTITGLQDFRNQLLLSDDAGLSPAAKLAEARRQYEEILALTQGDDIAKAQEAAGRLPGAAQTLLNLSRQVNASGPDFQSDLARVLADNAATIQRFQDLRTIEELMLDELRKIQNNTVGFREITPPIVNGVNGQSDGVAAGNAIAMDGFQLLSAKLDALAAKVDAGTSATTRVAGDLAAVLQ